MRKPCCPHGAARFAAAGALLAFCVSAPAQPANDDCADAMALAGEGIIPFSNVGATTDGPSVCAEQGSDVWVRYLFSTPGSVRVTTCTPALTFDSVLTAHRRCPHDPNDTAAAVACNDDDLAAGCASGGSTLRVRVGFGLGLLIQIGGADGAQGVGELQATPCPCDFDADGVVALPDLSLMLSEFGPNCGVVPCDTDLEGDGDVDLTDLAVLLGRFGTECP